MTLRDISWVCAIPLAAAATFACGEPVYRCKQADGTVLYTDYACAGATAVDLHPGTAAPDAKERLARAQAEIERAAVERKAMEREATARREELNRMHQTIDVPPQGYSEPVAYGDAFYAGPLYGANRSFGPNRFDSNRRGAHRRPGHDQLDKLRFRHSVPQVVRRPHPAH